MEDIKVSAADCSSVAYSFVKIARTADYISRMNAHEHFNEELGYGWADIEASVDVINQETDRLKKLSGGWGSSLEWYEAELRALLKSSETDRLGDVCAVSNKIADEAWTKALIAVARCEIEERLRIK